ncbi:hypothetical protein [Tenacibaculum agarivorans]|uniref:hypothetical protein n=1 Tax=Tenacibaculum agarivorans TaxID=1908389 RepID=UPI00117C91F6|nr:hypothetical protein [Tenacibaculum agarivorans]
MKKTILSLGKVLQRKDQLSINGGAITYCNSDADCIIPGSEAECVSACITNLINGTKVCVYDTTTCFGGIG